VFLALVIGFAIWYIRRSRPPEPVALAAPGPMASITDLPTTPSTALYRSSLPPADSNPTFIPPQRLYVSFC
jgi:hypothetical protein